MPALVTNNGPAVLSSVTRTRLLQIGLVLALGAIVLAVAAYAALSLVPHENASGQSSSDPNQRCSPSPCGAPKGFEVDVNSIDVSSGALILTVSFHNHTSRQTFESVSFRHTSPADFRLRAGGKTYQPVFNAQCPNWPELDVQRGATSPARTLCFAVATAAGGTLVWDPDLGVVSQPVSIPLA
ncbi:MAG TPA: hypothetical protein VKE27_12355 [Candidatus Dormibacteraeota bacterium]|nr:hypothetical protein [Candidatus Dormibacteraeota bacterium]